MDWIWELRCKGCGRAFEICRCCYTGQRYCNDDCRERGRAEQLRQAQRQYALTGKGQQALARAAAKYRARGKAARSGRGDDATDRSGVLLGDVAGVVAVAWRPVPCAERSERCETRRTLAIASWAETVHWLRFVIDQTLPGGGAREYLGVRRARCQLCGHEGPLVRPLLATNGAH